MATSIDWNGEYFVLTAGSDVCGNTFVYAYSYDGINWTKNVFPKNIVAQTPYSVKYLGGDHTIMGNLQSTSTGSTTTNCAAIVVDQSFSIAVNNNFDNSKIIRDIETNLEQQNRITFPRSLALALGNGHKIARSTDMGNTWISSSNASSIFSTSVNDAVWNGVRWVAVGTDSNNTIATSSDGNYWMGQGNYMFSSSCNGIDWSDSQNKYIAIGAGTNKLATSCDGVYWLGTNTSLFSVGNDIKWNGSIWVAVGEPSGANGTIAYSYDGVSWQYAANSFGIKGIRVYYDGTSWTVFGQDAAYNIATSSDGIIWTLSNVENASALRFALPSGQFPDASVNMYPGVPYPLTTVNSSIIPAVSKYTHNHSDRGYATIQPISVACGEGNTTMAYSVDGIKWIAIHNGIFTRCNKVVWNGVLWVAVGIGSYWTATSYDGIMWTGQDSILLSECYDVAWNGTWFVAVGKGKFGSSKIARSLNGISWTYVADSVFNANSGFITAIEWTGKNWLAYGSNTTGASSSTTAISNAFDGSNWITTPTVNLCATTPTSILGTNIFDASASTFASPAINAFDGSFNNVITRWSSAGGKYASNGTYTGSVSTTYNTSLSVSGEWLQVRLTSPSTMQYYYVVFATDVSNSIPKSWTLLYGSNGSTWTLADVFDFSTNSPPINSGNYPFTCVVIKPNSISANGTTYFRLVVTSSFGAEFVSIAELAMFDGGTEELSRYIRPVVLKDCILHPTRLLSVDGVVPNICIITDLSGNVIRNRYVHGQYVNNIIYGLNSEPSSSSFNGEFYVIGSTGGQITYLSNNASVTNLNFDNSMNGVALQSGITAVYAACYNKKFILLGGSGENVLSYGVLNANAPPAFYSTNASTLFTTVYGLASNSGYGFVTSPNVMRLQLGDKLSVITPKYYDNALSSETGISFNAYISDSSSTYI